MENIKKVIADRLDILMVEAEKHGKNQKQISIETDIPSNSLSQYHNGSREIRAYNLIKLAKYFNVSTDYLLGLTDVKSTSLDVQQICKLIWLSEEALKTICLFAFIDGKATCFEEAIKRDDKCCETNDRFANFDHSLLYYFNQLLENRDLFIDFLRLYSELSFQAQKRHENSTLMRLPEMSGLNFYQKANEEAASRDRFRLSQEVIKFLDAVEYPDATQDGKCSTVHNFDDLSKKNVDFLESIGYFDRRPELRPKKHSK